MDQLKADMLAGEYRFESPEGIVAGVEDAQGTIHITEGQHRINAALDILEETGEANYLNRLIESARQGYGGRTFLPRGTAPADSMPLPRR